MADTKTYIDDQLQAYKDSVTTSTYTYPGPYAPYEIYPGPCPGCGYCRYCGRPKPYRIAWTIT